MKKTASLCITLLLISCEQYGVIEPRACYTCTTTAIVKGPGTASVWTSSQDLCNRTAAEIKAMQDASRLDTPEVLTSIGCKLKQ